MENKVITVVITTYGRDRDMLERCVNSVLNQSFKDFELIVVDDNPPEKQAELKLDEYLGSLGDERVRYIPHEKNMGACAARNTGIAASKGEYVSFLDDDDEYLSDKLKVQYEALKDSDAGMVISDYAVKNDKSGEVVHVRLPYDQKNLRWLLICKNKVATPNPLIRRECFEACGPFDENMPSAQDVEMWMRVTEQYKTVILHKEVYIQHVHGGERITTANRRNKLIGNERLIEKNLEFLKKNKRAYSRLMFTQERRCLQLKDYKGAGKRYLKGVSLFPLHIFRYTAKSIFWLVKYNLRG
ncbi:MAG: glycosyltransferase family 2 protein [Lachnospiraceae bacterium]|nr:glycosyltransferase family 2 protein [Lachnospiraceae bacterium]